MRIPRQEVGAARIGGHVFVVGGLLSGPGLSATNTVERYDTVKNAWSFVCPMPVALDHVGCAALGGNLYVTGRYSADFAARRELWIYDPVADRWTEGASMPDRRGGHWSVAFGEKLYVFGGANLANAPQRSTFVYDPSVDEWSIGAQMQVAREHLTAAKAGEFVFVIGGRSGASLAANERGDQYVANHDADAHRAECHGDGVVWESYLCGWG